MYMGGRHEVMGHGTDRDTLADAHSDATTDHMTGPQYRRDSDTGPTRPRHRTIRRRELSGPKEHIQP